MLDLSWVKTKGSLTGSLYKATPAGQAKPQSGLKRPGTDSRPHTGTSKETADLNGGGAAGPAAALEPWQHRPRAITVVIIAENHSARTEAPPLCIRHNPGSR